VVRSRGPLARRANALSGGATRWNEQLLDRLNGGAAANGKTAVALDRDAVAAIAPVPGDSLRQQARDRFFQTPPISINDDQRKLVDALAAALGGDDPNSADAPPPKHDRRLEFSPLVDEIKVAINPVVTVLADVNARLDIPGGPLEKLVGIMVAPEFPEPMCEALMAVSTEWLLPGIGDVPPETIAGLSARNAFIEAFMVGLNHEMGRELLWRGYPTDQRGTYFKQFWDQSSRTTLPILNDIQTPLHEWRSTLGNNVAPGNADLVLLIRGQLLQRFPRAAIYLIAARRATGSREPDSSATPMLPVFRVFLDPDVTFLGFTISASKARGEQDEQGYFLVIEQPPMEPRFGLDEGDGQAPIEWSDLDWDDVGTTAQGYVRLSDGVKNASAPSGSLWAAESTAAQIAEITMQTAVRIAIHASNVLP